MSSEGDERLILSLYSFDIQATSMTICKVLLTLLVDGTDPSAQGLFESAVGEAPDEVCTSPKFPFCSRRAILVDLVPSCMRARNRRSALELRKIETTSGSSCNIGEGDCLKKQSTVI